MQMTLCFLAEIYITVVPYNFMSALIVFFHVNNRDFNHLALTRPNSEIPQTK